MSNESLFWKIARGELPPPECSKTLGMTMGDIDADAGAISATFEATEAFTNPAGLVQGGFLAAMLDDTLGPCVMAGLDADQIAPTLTMNIVFVSPAKPGQLTGRAKIVQRSSSVVHVEGGLYQNDQLVASATATTAIRTLRPR